MNAQQVWQSQSIDAPRVTIDYVRHGARSFERRIFWRNSFEYVGGTLVFVFFSYMAWTYWPQRRLFAASIASFALFAVYAVIQWNRKAGGRAAPADAGVLDTLRFQRQHLERQRDARSGNWRWWLPAFIPGAVLMVAAHYSESADPFNAQMVVLIGGLLLSVVGNIWIYEASARRLQREIDALDSLAKG